MKSTCLLTLVASLLAGSSALEVIHKQPLTSREKQAVGESLTKALQSMQNHAGGSKWEACASMFPNGQAPADQNSPTWVSCKSEFVAYAAASLMQQPLSSSDKQVVGEALTKALGSMQNHAGGSKWEACTSMFPNGQPPADQNTPTWVSCKSEFLAYAAASLVQQPMSSSDKKAVGAALSKALNALSNHAGGSKYEACADMFPSGKPPADQSNPTWVSCKSEFVAYAAASLLGTDHKGKRASLLVGSASLRGPLSGADKQAVGAALTKALSAMTNHAGGSKFEVCSDMFPNGKPPADTTSPMWWSCKKEFLGYAAAAMLQQPLSSSDKQAVGEALTKALTALQHHGGGSKYEVCADMFPAGQPPADQTSATWVSCKDQFSLVGTKSVVHHSSALHAVPCVALLAAALFF